MKLLFVVPSLKSGGLERAASILSSQWAGYEATSVVLLTLDNTPPFYPLDERVMVVQSPVSFNKHHRLVKALLRWFWLRKKARSIAPDAVLSFGEGFNAFVLFALRFLRKPIFLGNRTTPITSLQGFRGLVNPVAYRRAHGVFLQTQKSQELLQARYRGSSFVVIPNPIKSLDVEVRYDRTKLFFTGSMGGDKNQSELIDIFATLANDFPQWELVLAGDGPKRAALEAQVAALGLQDRVRMPGVVKDLSALYETGSIFAFTSLLEGFPNALGEAMNAGLAAIAYDCLTGPADLIEDGANGRLIPLGNRGAFTEALRQLMSSEALRRELGSEAKRRAHLYGEEAIARRYFTTLEAAVGMQDRGK